MTEPSDTDPAENESPPEIEPAPLDPVPRWIQGGPQAGPPSLEKPPANPPPPKSGTPAAPFAENPPPGRRFTAWLILILIVVLALVGTSPYWAPPLAPLFPWGTHPHEAVTVAGPDTTALTQRLQQTEAALKDVTARIGQLESRPAAAPADASTNIETADQRAALQEQIAKLNAALTALGDRETRLETGNQLAHEEAHSEQNLLLALANLRSALAGSGAFKTELDAVTALAPKSDAIVSLSATLAPSAVTGIPSLAILSERFSRETAPNILRAVPVSETAGWSDWIVAHVKRIVIIRRVNQGGTQSSDPTEATVARAEAALKANDLAGAVDAVSRLSGPQAEAAASWLADAKKRLAAEAEIGKAWRDVSAHTGADSGGAKP